MKNLLVTTGTCVLIFLGFYLGKHFYLKPKNITGDKASEIHGQLPNGNSFSLEELEGKYVLLDFWGSWCGPCRETHPQMVELYNRFQNQHFKDSSGFEIVSIAVEQNRESWASAIEADGLIWPYQLISLGDFDTPIIKSYHVKQIPTKFLINPKGIIIAVDPTLDEVAKTLETKTSDYRHNG
jgi:thiol-disulfide isomerase/thioredoxin